MHKFLWKMNILLDFVVCMVNAFTPTTTGKQNKLKLHSNGRTFSPWFYMSNVNPSITLLPSHNYTFCSRYVLRRACWVISHKKWPRNNVSLGLPSDHWENGGKDEEKKTTTKGSNENQHIFLAIGRMNSINRVYDENQFNWINHLEWDTIRITWKNFSLTVW